MTVVSENDRAIITPLGELAEAFTNTPAAVQDVLDKFGDQIETVAVDNSRSPSEAVFHAAKNQSALVHRLIESQRAFLESFRP